MKRILLLGLSLLLLSCGASVAVDFDEATDFTQYSSYNYYPSIDSGLNQLDERRVMRALDSLLPVKGITKSDTPDFLINFYARESIRPSNSAIGVGVGSGGGNVGVGVSGGIPIGRDRLEQEFTLDFVENEHDKLIWQGVTTSLLNEKASPMQKQERYNTLIYRILKKYPPKKK